MKTIITVFFLLSLVSSLYAQENQTKESKEKQSSKQSNNESSKKSSKKSVKKFIPSEKISADSSVSFPVDI